MTADSADPTPPSRTLSKDLLCETCDYNLRGLALTSTCPECGTAVVVSLRSRRMHQISQIFKEIASSYGWGIASVIFAPFLIQLPATRITAFRRLRRLCNRARMQRAHRLIGLSLQLTWIELGAMMLAIIGAVGLIAAPWWGQIAGVSACGVVVMETVQAPIVLMICLRFARSIDHDAVCGQIRATLTIATTLCALGLAALATLAYFAVVRSDVEIGAAACMIAPLVPITSFLTWLTVRDLSAAFAVEPEESISQMTGN